MYWSAEMFGGQHGTGSDTSMPGSIVFGAAKGSRTFIGSLNVGSLWKFPLAVLELAPQFDLGAVISSGAAYSDEGSSVDMPLRFKRLGRGDIVGAWFDVRY